MERIKNKAEELVDKMYNCDKSTPNEAMAMLYPHAKQCALIAVDEILNLLINVYEFDEFDNGKVEYWKEVKIEIEKL